MTDGGAPEVPEENAAATSDDTELLAGRRARPAGFRALLDGHAKASGRFRVLRSFQTGIALGGGAARGLAHVGVLKVLEREGVHPTIIAGTSAGALVGGMFAAMGSADAVARRLAEFAGSERFQNSGLGAFRQDVQTHRRSFIRSVRSLFRRGLVLGVSVTKPSFVTEEAFRGDLAELLPEAAIEDLPIPFAAVASCIATGQEVVIRKGPLREAVAASCALPGVLPPVEWNGRVLIDGGAVNKVPATVAKQMGADFVVAVDIHADLEEDPSLLRGISILNRSHTITGHRLRELLLEKADVVVRPRVGHIHWADFARYQELFELGEAATQERIPAIKKSRRKARWRAFLLPWRRPAKVTSGVRSTGEGTDGGFAFPALSERRLSEANHG